MTYKVKQKKGLYPYGRLEEQELMRKYKGRVPPFTEITRVETRKILRVPEKLHTKGELVTYEKGKVGIITEVDDKGIYVNQIKQNGIAKVEKKPTFIPEKDLKKGKAYPYYVFTLS